MRRLVAERRIPYLKWGHLLRFDPRDIAAWLDDSRVQPRVMSQPLATLRYEETAGLATGRRSGSQRPGAA